MMSQQKTKTSAALRVAVTALLILAGTVTYAQPPGGDGPPPASGNGSQAITPDEIAETQTSWMKKKLKLTKQQTEEVKKINKQYVTQTLEYQTAEKKQAAPATGGRENRLKEKMAELDRDRDNRLKKILTEKQFRTYLKKKGYLEESISTAASQEMPPGPPPGGF